MTTASPTTDDDGKEFSTKYRRAQEFLAPERDDEGPNRAEAIVWYDQERPIFVCCPCHGEMARLQWEGHRKHPAYDTFRADCYRRLVEQAPACDVCAGTIPDGVLL